MNTPHERIGLMVLCFACAGGALAQDAGPSTGWSANLIPTDAGVRTVSLLSVGDSVNLRPDGATPYRMVGKPDGLGAFDNGDGTFTVLMNHELSDSEGIERAHGAGGAFVSRWVIDSATLEVLHGSDLIQTAGLWNAGTGSFDFGPAVFSRFCSGDLPEAGAFYNTATGLGSQEMIYLNGEEAGTEGRGFAHFVTGADAGVSYEIPGMGNTSLENVVANPGTGDATVLIGLDDVAGGQLYVYVGAKSGSGTGMEKAGLLGGTLYGLRVIGVPSETIGGLDGATSAAFDLASLGDASSFDGATVEAFSNLIGVTRFARPEDGAWVPGEPDKFVWATTGTGGVPTRLWLLTFDDMSNPAAGGTIEILVEGDAPGLPVNMDNIAVDADGRVLIQEDGGNSSRLAKVWDYSLTTGALTEMIAYDPLYFLDSGQPDFRTQNEESSGIVSMQHILGDGWFLLTSQAHYDIGDVELDQDGQLLLMYSAMHNGCDADLVSPFELLNFFDVAEYIRAFVAGEGKADVAQPFGVLNFFDVQAYIGAYGAGCP